MDNEPSVVEQERMVLADTLRRAEEALRLPVVAPRENLLVEPFARQPGQQMRVVGERVIRPDSRMHGLGQTSYIDDLAFPGMLYAKIRRAGIASARIKRIDTSAAEAMPGVMAVVTGRDIAVNSFGPSYQDQPVLADEIVRHAGDGVAAVAAVTEQIAAEAAQRIAVEYETLPAVLDPLEAMREGSPLVHAPNSNIYASKVIRKGDIDKAFAQSDQIFEGRFTTQMVEHVSLEPHAAIANWDANGRVTVWLTIGRITLAQADLSRTLKLPMSRVRVIATIVGGNFGGKNEITQEPVLAILSRKTGRPVKGVFTRGDEFISTTTRHPCIMEYKTGVTRDGRILARKVRLILDGGAYCSWSATTLGKACILSCGPYKIDHILAEAFVVYTNKTMTGAMRGFGAPQVCFAYESHMDDIAKALGIDPLSIRLRNVFEEGSISPTGQVLQSVVIKEALLKVTDRFGWEVPS